MLNLISSQASKLVSIAKKSTLKSQSKSKIITITSGKGGVGKSTFTANIAYLLSLKGFKVAVIDADIGLANMQVLFNLKPKITLFDYIEGKVSLDDTLLQTQYKNISLIAGKSAYQYANNSNSSVFSRIAEDVLALNRFDYILIDTGAGLNEYVKEFLSVSNNILAITTTDPSALTDLYALMKMLSKDKSSLMICFNHTKNYRIGETITNSLKNLSKKNRLNNNFMIKYIGNVSSSRNVSTTGRLRKLFVNEFSNDAVCKELEIIVEALLINIS